MTVPGVYSPEQLQSHVDKVIASDGVDDSKAVEVMARALLAIRVERTDETWKRYRYQDSWKLFADDARAALGALRALEGE